MLILNRCVWVGALVTAALVCTPRFALGQSQPPHVACNQDAQWDNIRPTHPEDFEEVLYSKFWLLSPLIHCQIRARIVVVNKNQLEAIREFRKKNSELSMWDVSRVIHAETYAGGLQKSMLVSLTLDKKQYGERCVLVIMYVKLEGV